MKLKLYKIFSCALLSVASCVILQAMQQTREVPSLQTIIKEDLIKKLLEGTVTEKQLSEALQGLATEVREPLQKKIKDALISNIIQGKPVKSYDTSVGQVTEFSDGSKRIDDYLGIGDTLYLSPDLERYLQTDASGNVRMNSLDKEFISDISAMYDKPQIQEYELFGEIRSQSYPYRITSNHEQERGPFLDLLYPESFKVTFQSNKPTIKAGSKDAFESGYLKPGIYFAFQDVAANRIKNELPLHKAITNLNKDAVVQFIRNLYSDEENRRAIPMLLNYVFVTDNALHRAIKKALSATTDKQLDDAKAIIKILIHAEANINKPNIDGKTALDLAQPNPELRKFIEEQAKLLTIINTLRQNLRTAIAQRDRVQIENIIKIAKHSGMLGELLNISYSTDKPLIYTLEKALNTTDKSQLKAYLDIAQLLINNGATLTSVDDKEFFRHYGKQYREKLAPYLKV